jgi:hypothetical protein
MRTWWEVADEVRGGVVRAREWWIENETAAIKCRLVSAGERASASRERRGCADRCGFWKQACFSKKGKMNRYSYNLARGAAKNGRGTLANVSPSSRIERRQMYDAHRGTLRRSFLGHAICCSARGFEPASSPTGFAALL